MSKVFDTNLYFQLLGLFYGTYDGKIINRNGFRSTFLYCYSMFMFILISASLIRYSFLVYWPRKTVLEYYLCDYAQMMKSTGSYRWMMCCGLLILNF